MKSIIKLVSATALMMSLVACASGPTHTLDQANNALKEAEAANAAVKKVHYEWRDTGKLIKKAREAKGKGDFDTAVKDADKAKRQAMHAMAQYKEQMNAGPRF